MISIIICSRKPDISTPLKENIKKTIGVDYELVVVDNSNNDYSIFSAYNKGAELSKNPYLCFVHEDVLFKTENWGKNLINHILDKETGIIGIAGGIMMTKIPSPTWSVGRKNMYMIQHRKKRNIKKKYYIKEPNDFNGTLKPALLLDGVFLAMRRDMFSHIRFDENLIGFHGYDFDICVQSAVAGYKNYVAYDILLEHFSPGDRNNQYCRNLIEIYKKWEKNLPLFSDGISEEIYRNIDEIQRISLEKFIRRLARNGFEEKEIIDTAIYYAKHLNTASSVKVLRFLRLKILFEQIFNSNRKLRVQFIK